MNLGRYIGLLALIFSLYILWQIRQLLLLVFTAIVLATALNQLVKLLHRWKLKRSLAIWLSIGTLLIVLSVFLVLIVPPFIQQFERLLELLPSSIVEIEELLLRISGFLPEQPWLDFTEIDNLFQQIQPLIDRFLGESLKIFFTSINTILQVILVLVLTLMLLSNPAPYKYLFVRLFPSFYRQRVSEILVRCETALSSWTTGILIEMLFITALSGIGLWILQVPLALAHAIIAGLLNFIPNVGPTLSVFLPMAIALIDAPWKAGAVLILYVIIQQIESYWLTPTIMAKQVSLLPAITLTTQLIFASLFGALGLLIALPLTIVVGTWIEEVLFKDILDKWKKSLQTRI
ncbi:MAG TPA: AI-2E family transporter [Coleofasciculaceae cyanobacterium]|jgi:predicted PurR-regulated permease PerM